MSDVTLSSEEQALSFLHYAVMDDKGLCVRSHSKTDAITTARRWNERYPADGNHRAVEVLVRDVKP